MSIDGKPKQKIVSIKLELYEPILKFNEGEEYFPTKIEDMIKHSDIWKYRLAWQDVNLTKEGIDTSSKLKEYLKDHPDSTIYFKVDDDYLKSWQSADYVVYGREYRYQGKIYLQYWFFYISNPWITEHEGDWEMITIELDEDGNPLRVGYSQHHGGEAEPVGTVKGWSELMKIRAIEGNHPVVYVAKGSHANYPHKGKTNVIIGSDKHYGNGLVITPSDYELLSIEEGGHWEWINIQQLRWGEYHAFREFEYPESEYSKGISISGPKSPIAQGDKWKDPRKWLDEIQG